MIADLEHLQKFCYGISFKEFCLNKPHFCKRPKNMKKFCKNHPTLCIENTSNLMIPKAFKSNELLTGHLAPYLLNDSYNDAQLFLAHGFHSETRTFIHNYQELFKCYSKNLHLFQSGSKLKTYKIDFFRPLQNLFSFYKLDQVNIELFSSKDESQVFFAVHSPYVPIDSTDLQAIRPGKSYKIDINLETEEHLLPPPYQTDCRDNGPSKDVKNFTNPNSYEMCLDLCKSKYNKRFHFYCLGMKMVMSEDDLCFHAQKNLTYQTSISTKPRNVWDEGIACLKNCKQGCLKLQYSYKINEKDLDSQVSYRICNEKF
ncbi:unnamed protein product [Larinioides sclopetarius]|uniref:Uncharacterized protein n=1 Tax=Larinioides sclopetarius TaxID=280406 RepID=A0AAV2BTH7_9ARAC